LSGAELSPGAVFGGDFKVVRALRSGGMGAVYVVDQLSTGKQRALKVMAAELTGDPATRERFVLEARAASAVDSDHVVEIVTAGIDTTSGAPFLVMELLRGEDLDDACMRLGPLPLGDVAEVISQVGHALELAHAQGIVHRDLKPENIFLSTSRRRNAAFTAKILDFGIAKLVEGSQHGATQPLGTPLYMPPEQTERAGQIRPASDVWALGLIVFRLLTGAHFWREADGSIASLLREIVLGDIPFATVRVAELGCNVALPPGFDAWFSRCVNRDTGARFQEAGEAVRAFLELVPPDAPKGLLDGRARAAEGGEPSRPTGPSVPVELEATAYAPSPKNDDPHQTSGTYPKGAELAVAAPASGAPKSKLGMVLGGGAALVALVAGAVIAARGGSTPPSARVASPSASLASAAPTVSLVQPVTCPPNMVLIAGASVVLGARDLEPDALSKPTHEVTLSTFCLDRTEVTAKDYDTCAENDGCERALDHVSWPDIDAPTKKRLSVFCNAKNPERASHPANCVAWTMADRYCKKRKARLPTEAEWEYAARGPKQRRYPWGDEPPTPKHLNVCGAECVAWARTTGLGLTSLFPNAKDNDGFPGTAPVGMFPLGASSSGVLDLAGNVYEWTADFYAPYDENASRDPTGPEKGTERVARGGGFLSTQQGWINPAWRYKTDPDTYNHAIGFRCASAP
jgi:eukaryotic-like serine/threonine-protein kinase